LLIFNNKFYIDVTIVNIYTITLKILIIFKILVLIIVK